MSHSDVGAILGTVLSLQKRAGCPGMISGKLLQSLCPAPGACRAELDGAPPAIPAEAGQGLATSALKAGGTATGEALVQACDGRRMWLIIGLITLSSPLAILLTQVPL